jgi:hypothetical protein
MKQTRTALLDTNAMIRISAADLATATELGWHLTTSPWSFFERLRHLDEEPDFAKAKGNLMKFREVEIIDKPLDRAASDLVHPKEPQVWSSDLCYAALAAIDAARSYDVLANSVLVDEAGKQRGPLKDVAQKVRETLDEAERKFQDYMTSMIATLKTGGAARRSPEQNHRFITDTVRAAGGLPLPDTPGFDYSTIDPDVAITGSYCFWGYSLFQAVWLESNGAVTCDKNDLEDGQLCAYVPLDEELWVVAGDKKLSARLSEILELLNAVGLGQRARFHPATSALLTRGGAL